MTEYWTVSQGTAIRTGWSCRECKEVIMKGSPVIVRDGRKMRFFYHVECYSGEADPRSQEHSSYHQGRFSVSETAPSKKGFGKWSTSYGFAPR
eukprot:tig00021434_g21304.t1